MRKLKHYEKYYSYEGEDVTETIMPLLPQMMKLSRKITAHLLYQMLVNDQKSSDCMNTAFIKGFVLGATTAHKQNTNEA